MAFCTSCGKQIPADSRFCEFCGCDMGDYLKPEEQPEPEPMPALSVPPVTVPEPVMISANAPERPLGAMSPKTKKKALLIILPVVVLLIAVGAFFLTDGFSFLKKGDDLPADNKVDRTETTDVNKPLPDKDTIIVSGSLEETSTVESLLAGTWQYVTNADTYDANQTTLILDGVGNFVKHISFLFPTEERTSYHEGKYTIEDDWINFSGTVVYYDWEPISYYESVTFSISGEMITLTTEDGFIQPFTKVSGEFDFAAVSRPITMDNGYHEDPPLSAGPHESDLYGKWQFITSYEVDEGRFTTVYMEYDFDEDGAFTFHQYPFEEDLIDYVSVFIQGSYEVTEDRIYMYGTMEAYLLSDRWQGYYIFERDGRILYMTPEGTNDTEGYNMMD